MLLRIKVKPGSKVDEITREADGSLKVKIKAQPVEGKANTYLVEYLSGLLQIPKSKIRVLKGANNQFKTLEIEGDEEVVMGKLGV
jgi:uncharacterized protein (TIGR00251 family)